MREVADVLGFLEGSIARMGLEDVSADFSEGAYDGSEALSLQ